MKDGLSLNRREQGLCPSCGGATTSFDYFGSGVFCETCYYGDLHIQWAELRQSLTPKQRHALEKLTILYLD
jgi:reverse gyrase